MACAFLITSLIGSSVSACAYLSLAKSDQEVARQKTFFDSSLTRMVLRKISESRPNTTDSCKKKFFKGTLIQIGNLLTLTALLPAELVLKTALIAIMALFKVITAPLMLTVFALHGQGKKYLRNNTIEFLKTCGIMYKSSFDSFSISWRTMRHPNLSQRNLTRNSNPTGATVAVRQSTHRRRNNIYTGVSQAYGPSSSGRLLGTARDSYQ